MMEETFTVASVADCETVLQGTHRDDYMWRETEVGCKLLQLLQEIHKFNITYSYINDSNMTTDYYERKAAIYNFVDIYAKPRTLWATMLYNGTPITPVLAWNFGFILRRAEPDIHHFYSLPFSAPVWHSILAMMLLVSVLFYILNRAEQSLSGGRLKCYLWSELLIVLGIICQHYISINHIDLTSRRIAFISFFFCSYLTYCYYTSTLLSDIVHDKDNEMDLDNLADSSYELSVLDSGAFIIKLLTQHLNDRNNKMTPHLRFIQRKLKNGNVTVVNITTGLAAVKGCNTALLSDYVSLYPAMKNSYTMSEVCELIKVHLFSNAYKYLFTSKNFKYIEEFKISTLRAKESGVLHRLFRSYDVLPLIYRQCADLNFQAHLGHVYKPFMILVIGYVLSVLIVLGERAYYKRYKVWPYVE